MSTKYSTYAPDVYFEEIQSGLRPIMAVGTSIAGFVGDAPTDAYADPMKAQEITSRSHFMTQFPLKGKTTPLYLAVLGFFENGGSMCYVVNTKGKTLQEGLDVLATIDEVAIVVAPGATSATDYEAVITHCETLKDRIGILDPREGYVTSTTLLTTVTTGAPQADGSPDGLLPKESDKVAFYYPYITVRDPLTGKVVETPPSGHMAGIWAQTDGTRGVHKAPANVRIRGALDVTHRVSREQHGLLNDKGVNVICYKSSSGVIPMGARTRGGPGSERLYVNVSRFVTMVMESIEESSRWMLFEPNDPILWGAAIRNVTNFLKQLWRDRALQGRTAEQAFFVKCDEETNPPENINMGVLTIVIGLAPTKPAEYVVFQLSVALPSAEEAPTP